MNRTAILFAATLALIFATGSCKSKKQEVPQLRHSVMVTTPSASGGVLAKNFSGVVKEQQSINLAFLVSGKIESILVKEGDRVGKGQLVATLDANDYQLAYEAAKTQYEQLKAEVGRMQKLYEARAISGNDYEKAASGLEQARISMQAKKNQLDYTRLTAPVGGIVQHVNFEPSEQSGAGQAIIELLDVSRLEVEINVPVDVYKQRGRFREVYGLVRGQKYSLRPVSLQPKADANQLFALRYAIDAQLSAGESVDVYINMAPDSTSRGLTLPTHAFVEHGGKTCVFVVDTDSVVHRREVVLGNVDKSGQVIVIQGLQSGESVVRTGASVLTDGEKVTVIGQVDKSNVGGLL